MTPSTTSPTRRPEAVLLSAAALLVAVLAVASLLVGKYPLTVSGIFQDEMQRQVFLTLRLPRALTGVCGGFALGVCGFVYQTVFRNPLASPDIIGVSSGASAGAAAGILFLSGAAEITLAAFGGALAAVLLALGLSALDRRGQSGTIVLAGIAVHALAQTVLMALKLTADPERELASIEYWIMGSLNGVKASALPVNLFICALCVAALFALHRQVLLLSAEEGEARMLGVNVTALRLLVLLAATLAVASLTGLVSFVGLLAPHAARLVCKGSRLPTLVLSGLCGSALLCAADILARSVAATELPVSIFTSLLGAPFLVFLLVREGRKV